MPTFGTTRLPCRLWTITLPGISGTSMPNAWPFCVARARLTASAAGPLVSSVRSTTRAVVRLSIT